MDENKDLKRNELEVVKTDALIEEFSIVELEDRLEFLVRSDNRSR